MVVAAEELETRQLFGGMASMQCPARLVDISDFRPVPDHQEVLTDASADQSVIVEILVRPVPAQPRSYSAVRVLRVARILADTSTTTRCSPESATQWRH